MKKCIFILSAINTVITVLLLVFTGVIRTLTDIYLPLGALLVLPLVISAVYVCEAVLLLLMIAMLRSARARILSTVLLIALTILVIFFPVTKSYGIVNYRLFYDVRTEFIESAYKVNQTYSQIDTETYFINDIRVSYSGSVIVHSENDETVIVFGVFSGLTGHTSLIYSSVPREMSTSDANLGEIRSYFKSITQINDHWFYAES